MEYALEVAEPYDRLPAAAVFASERGPSTEERDAHREKRQTPGLTYDQVGEQLDRYHELGISKFYFQAAFKPTDTGKLLNRLGVT